MKIKIKIIIEREKPIETKLIINSFFWRHLFFLGIAQAFGIGVIFLA